MGFIGQNETVHRGELQAVDRSGKTITFRGEPVERPLSSGVILAGNLPVDDHPCSHSLLSRRLWSVLKDSDGLLRKN